MSFLIGGLAGFALAMFIFERELLMGWMKTSAAWINTQWQKVTKKR